MGAAVSSSLRELGLEEMKMEQWKTLEVIGLDSREVLLLSSTPDAKVMIVLVTALELEWLKKRNNVLKLL